MIENQSDNIGNKENDDCNQDNSPEDISSAQNSTTENDELREYVYQIICDKVILKYKEKLGIDDVEFTDEVIGD